MGFGVFGLQFGLFRVRGLGIGLGLGGFGFGFGDWGIQKLILEGLTGLDIEEGHVP